MKEVAILEWSVMVTGVVADVSHNILSTGHTLRPDGKCEVVKG